MTRHFRITARAPGSGKVDTYITASETFPMVETRGLEDAGHTIVSVVSDDLPTPAPLPTLPDSFVIVSDPPNSTENGVRTQATSTTLIPTIIRLIEEKHRIGSIVYDEQIEGPAWSHTDLEREGSHYVFSTCPYGDCLNISGWNTIDGEDLPWEITSWRELADLIAFKKGHTVV